MLDEDFGDEKTVNETQPQRTNQDSKKSDKPLIYVGPNMPKLGLEKYTVYKEGLPPNVEEACEKIPEIIYVLIPVDELLNYTGKILNPASPERKYLQIINQKMKGL